MSTMTLDAGISLCRGTTPRIVRGFGNMICVDLVGVYHSQ